MITHSESITKLATALVKFHKNLKPPTNTKQVNMNLKTGGRVSYSYIDLPELLNELRPQLADCDLMIKQAPYSPEGKLGIETILLHSSGEYFKSHFDSQKPMGGAQKEGSLITYFRRYAILSILGLGQDDDDGAQATNSYNNKTQQHTNKAPLASEKQKVTIKKFLSKDEYEAHKEFIETLMTQAQASDRIKKLIEESKK